MTIHEIKPGYYKVDLDEQERRSYYSLSSDQVRDILAPSGVSSGYRPTDDEPLAQREWAAPYGVRDEQK